MSSYISTLDSAFIKLRSKCKKDASKKLLPKEKEALLVLVGMVTIPVMVSGIIMIIG